MKITEVRIRLVADDEKLKAVASVTFDDEFAVHDIKVLNGKDGMFIAMPSRKLSDDRYADIAHPLNSAFRMMLRDEVMGAYEKALNNC